jgi:replicative DNA helicase
MASPLPISPLRANPSGNKWPGLMPVSLSALQENLICVLSFDDQHCMTVRNLVEPEWWGGPFALIAARIYEFLDRYKKSPKEHIADLMADKLDKKNKRETELYEDILLSIKEQSGIINTEYVMNQLGVFVKRQSLRTIAIDLAKALQKDTDESLEEAERLMAVTHRQQSAVFDAGLRLSNKDRVLDFLDQQDHCFPTGIAELDKRGFGPTRKELWLYIAAAKRGKTWMLIQLAKMAMVHRLRVCHITLEMSEDRSAQRYMQALFAMAKRNEKKIVTKFTRDSLGRMEGFEEKEIKPKLSMDDLKIRQKLEKKIDLFGARLLDNVFIKQFPTGTLSVRQLEAYLDSLESNERFVPDLLIVDYPDLMKLDKDNYRLAIDEVYKELRGIAVTRNLALAVVSQGNRSSEKAKNVGSEHVAEAWSKIAHADCVITYQQTAAELKMGLARLYVAGGRNDQDKVSIIISQNYATGVFSVDSILMAGANYWGLIGEETG